MIMDIATMGIDTSLVAKDLARLHGLCFSKPWSEPDLAHYLQSPQHWVGFDIVIDCAISLIILQVLDIEAEIISFGTDPGYRRQGLGRNLLQRTLGQLSDRGVVKVYLEVDQSNEAALGLYRSFGFVVVGVRKAYYEGGHNFDHASHDAYTLSLMI